MRASDAELASGSSHLAAQEALYSWPDGYLRAEEFLWPFGALLVGFAVFWYVLAVLWVRVYVAYSEAAAHRQSEASQVRRVWAAFVRRLNTRKGASETLGGVAELPEVVGSGLSAAADRFASSPSLRPRHSEQQQREKV